MYLLQNNSGQASTLLRSLLAIVFIVWLANVMTQYDEKTTTQKPKISIKQPPSNIVIEQFALPPIPKPKAKSQTSAIAKQVKPPAEPVAKMAKQSPQTPPVDKQQVEQIYQKLSDEAVDIQIAWPQNVNERHSALNFMYRCVGVQFAVLNGSTLTKFNHTKFNHTKFNHTKRNHSELIDYSDWVRIAQGSLSNKEHNWLNAYALAGTPIRLFPRHIDWRLSQYLAKALKGLPLASLRAKYQVTNRRLELTHIYLNNQRITASWLLFHGKC
jgi:hypothetical protein